MYQGICIANCESKPPKESNQRHGVDSAPRWRQHRIRTQTDTAVPVHLS